MPTVIDSLVVNLGLDSSKFEQGQKNTSASLKKLEGDTTKTSAEMERRGAQGAEFFNGMKRASVALSAVLAGLGINDFMKAVVQISKTGAALQNVSHALDMNAKDLAAWQRAAVHIANGTTEAVTSSFETMSNDINNFMVSGGQSNVLQVLRQLQVDAADAENKLRPLGDILLDVSQKMQGMDPARQAAIGRMLGLDPGMIALLMKGPAAIRTELAAQMNQSPITDKNVKAMEELNTATIGLEQNFTALSQGLLIEFLPAILTVIHTLNDLIDWARGKISLAQLQERQGITAYNRQAALNAQGAGPHGARSEAAADADWRMQHPVESFLDRIQHPHLVFNGGNTPPDNGDYISAPASGTPAADVMEQARSFFRGKGLSEAQTAGVLSNIAAESSFNPSLSGDNGTSYGLFQHHAERLAALRARYGQNPTAQQQLEFAWWEMTQGGERGALDGVLAAQTPFAAGAAFTQFERPADIANRARARGNAAAGFMPGGTQGNIWDSTLDRIRNSTAANPGAARAVGNLSSLNRMRYGSNSQFASNTSTSATHIGTINVVTQATNATGIASAIRGALSGNPMATQANRGLA